MESILLELALLSNKEAFINMILECMLMIFIFMNSLIYSKFNIPTQHIIQLPLTHIAIYVKCLRMFRMDLRYESHRSVSVGRSFFYR